MIAPLNRRRFLSLTMGGAAAIVVAGRAGMARATAPSEVTSASGAFLDAQLVHEIAVSFDQGAYDAMVEAYSASGDKEWIEAAVAIDGSTYEKAGMRLKGNSSLGGRIMTKGPENDQGTPVAGAMPPDEDTFFNSDDSQATPVAGSQAPDGESSLNEMNGEGNWEEPERLPWLIRLDKFVDDQDHDGLKELVIRSNGSKTSLNEAVALDLLAAAGLASQLAAYTGFSVNGSDPALRLAIEHPNDDWMELRFSKDGLLYKGEATGDYTYRGDDPTSYNEVFDLEAGGTGDDAVDMKPLIEFLDFLNNSDDQTFASEIEKRFDVPQFAIYEAMMLLTNNFDDLSGPGNNGYLYFDPEATQFTVVPWDMNLAFGGLGGGLNREFGGDGQPGEFPDDSNPPPDDTESFFGTPVAGEETPGQGPQIQVNGPNGGRGPKANPLIERTKKIAEYSTLIDDETDRLRTDLYTGGIANDILSRWVNVLESGAGSMVDTATITSESDEIAKQFK
jgi:spore coat protein CotH